MKTSENPYPQCATCKTLTDCPHPETAVDLLGSPLPPDVCPKPMEVMARTLKKKKLIDNQHGLS